MQTYEISSDELKTISDEIRLSSGPTRQKAEAVVSQLYKQIGVDYTATDGKDYDGFISKFKATTRGNVSMTRGALEALSWAVNTSESQDILYRAANSDSGQQLEMKLNTRMRM